LTGRQVAPRCRHWRAAQRSCSALCGQGRAHRRQGTAGTCVIRRRLCGAAPPSPTGPTNPGATGLGQRHQAHDQVPVVMHGHGPRSD
jgi:hypothetical protein